MLLVPRRNPIRLRQDDQRAISQLKIDIKISNDEIFFIKNMSAGSTHTKCYLVKVDMDQLELGSMRDYEVYCFQWYIRQYEYCNKYPTMKCRFWSEIITNNQDVTLINMFPVKPSKVHKLLKKSNICVVPI